MLIRRRTALLGLTSSWALGRSALALANDAATPADARFVVVILRGAMDGLSTVAPYGDPMLAQWRGGLILPEPGQPGGLLDLGGRFGLHPALARVHGFYAEGAALPVHAVAGHYRSRSHFEAQDYMESGADERLTSGWLNRATAALPKRAQTNGVGSAALSLGLSVPLLLRGPTQVGAFAPESGRLPDPELYAAIARMNAGDRLTGPAWREGLRARGYAEAAMAPDADAAMQPPVQIPGQMQGQMQGQAAAKPSAFEVLSRACGTMLARADGPRIAALEVGGWDTHASQKPRLAGALATLDRGLGGLRDSLGPAWSRTVVLVMTEFGRTVRMNGTGGTDHGTATVAFLLGGAVAGGRVGGDWPGLAAAQMFENRDLAPTTDLRALASGVLRDHLGLRRAAMPAIFPGGDPVEPATGLIRV